MRRVIKVKKVSIGLFIILIILLVIVFASSFRNRDYGQDDFPYKGALFLHDGDYVIFECTEGYNGFYYMTGKDYEVPVQVFDYNTGKEIGGYLFLPGNPYPVGENFSYAPFRWMDLQQGYKGRTLKIVLRENRKIYNKTYGDRDLLIKFKPGTTVLYWHGVDSTDWCDLDYVAK